MSRSLYQIQKSVLLLSWSSLSGGATANDGPLAATAIDGSVLRRFILFLIFFSIVACAHLNDIIMYGFVLFSLSIFFVVVVVHHVFFFRLKFFNTYSMHTQSSSPSGPMGEKCDSISIYIHITII